MTRLIAVLMGLSLLAAMPRAAAQDTKPADIDWSKARGLLQAERQGQQLTPDEKVYLDKAKVEVAAGRGPGASSRRSSTGTASSAPAAREKTGLVPLCDMTAKETYKGEDGGLYGKGRNTPPQEQMEAAKKALASIQPLDKDGKPAADGKIVLMSLGMSNTTNEFSVFKAMADKDPDRNPQLVIVDGAQGGQAAKQWSSADSKVWAVAEQRLAQAGVTARQIQVIWCKQAQPQPAQFGQFPKHAQMLKEDIIKDIEQAKQHYPNLQVVYLSSRIYAGYAKTSLNPEPYAYEGALAVRWVIQDQIKGAKQLNYDSAKGDVKAPVLLWGPYLWADGVAGRKADKLVWNIEDLGGDGTHPSDSGRKKVAQLLLDFFKKGPSAGTWFTKPAETK